MKGGGGRGREEGIRKIYLCVGFVRIVSTELLNLL